jgi:cell division protein FtsN
MNPNANDNPNELVLDNRKLIIAFLLLIVTCGAFFLIGFMEGKRQGQSSRADLQVPPVVGASKPAYPTPTSGEPTAATGGQPVDNSAIRSQLDWYGKVNAPTSKQEKDAVRPKPAQPPPARQIAVERAAAPAPTKRETETRVGATASRYHVQVGAFRQSDQAKSQVAALQAKGYVCSIIPPSQAGGLYLVRVGDFPSRTDAVGMQLRLKKDGFSSFVKTTK